MPPFEVFCIARAVEVRLRSCKARISLQMVLCMCYKSFEKTFLVLLAYYYISTRQFCAFLSPLRRHLVHFVLLVFYISDFESVEHIYPYRWYSECATKVWEIIFISTSIKMHSDTCYFWWLSYSRLHTSPFTVFCIARVVKVQLRSYKACISLYTVLWMCYQSFEKKN